MRILDVVPGLQRFVNDLIRMRLDSQVVLGTLVWSWTGGLVMLSRERWRRLPGALIGAVTTLVCSAGSHLVMPRYAGSNAAQLGPSGSSWRSPRG